VTENFLRLNFTPLSGITPGTNDIVGMDCDQILARYDVTISGASSTGVRIPGQNQITSAILSFFYDSDSFLGGQTSSPVTSSMTIPSTSNLLIVCIAVPSGSARSGDSPTWNGVTMTLAASNTYCEIWQLANPDTGTHTISVPNTGGSTIHFSLQAYHAAGYKSLYNSSADSGTDTNATGTVTIPNDTEMLVIQAIAFRANGGNTLSFTGESDNGLWRGVSGAVWGAAFQYNVYKSTTTSDTLYENISNALSWYSVIVAFTSV
jgi:hypothetical protein